MSKGDSYGIFWYIVAALGAGVGTGLAGLSAATMMVPILIVLCPSFGGEYGAYQATAIVLERWPVLIICIVTATAASLVSAQFANRVNNRTVGRVTGVILTILGAAMIYLNYFC